MPKRHPVTQRNAGEELLQVGRCDYRRGHLFSGVEFVIAGPRS
jgi:hypothetical protein